MGRPGWSKIGTPIVHRLQPRHYSAHPAKAEARASWRFDAIRPFVEGKRVLDLGAGRSYKNMHRRLSLVCSHVLALEIDNEIVEEMIHAGFKAVEGDAEHFHLDSRFDVVFAGEIIEHLTNFSGFFRSVANTLTDNGLLIITTPNAFKLSGFLYRIGNGRPPINPDHTVWFCSQTISRLTSACQFEVVSVEFIDPPGANLARRLLRRLAGLFLSDQVLASTLLVIARPTR